MKIEVIEVYGQFATLINQEVKLYPTRAQAQAAATLHLKGAAFVEKAIDYTNSIGSEGKAAKTVQNTIVAFLAWDSSDEVHVAEITPQPMSYQPVFDTDDLSEYGI